MLGLTPKQSAVLDFIKAFIGNNGYSPSYEEIAIGLGYSSLSTVHGHIKRLQERGHVELAGGSGRSIRPI